MKLLLLSLLVLALFLQESEGRPKKKGKDADAEEDEEKKKEDKEESDDDDDKKKPKDFKSMFEGFFKLGDNKEYKKFIRESRKGMRKAGIKLKKDPKLDADDDDDEDKDEDEKDKDEDEGGDKKGKETDVPLPAKTFAFYGKTYGCQKSKVYKEFLSSYKKGETGDPDEYVGDDKWLKKLSDGADDIDVDGEKKEVKAEDAAKKLEDLDKSQVDTLSNGEKDMPLPAKTFVHFIKAKGCDSSAVKKYQDFKAQYKKVVDESLAKKKAGKKLGPEYYLAKADTIIFEMEDKDKE